MKPSIIWSLMRSCWPENLQHTTYLTLTQFKLSFCFCRFFTWLLNHLVTRTLPNHINSRTKTYKLRLECCWGVKKPCQCKLFPNRMKSCNSALKQIFDLRFGSFPSDLSMSIWFYVNIQFIYIFLNKYRLNWNGQLLKIDSVKFVYAFRNAE